MTATKYQIIAEMFRTFIKEDSTAIGVFGNVPGGKAVAQKLHTELALAHDQTFVEVPKIAWSELKDMYGGGWVLIRGAKGAGAIQSRSGMYRAVAINPENNQVETYQDGRGGNVIEFLKNRIGKLLKFYVGKESGSVPKKQRDRADKKDTKDSLTTFTPEKIIKKFKPLWVKSIEAAEADIRGMITTMIKNGAYEKAERKLKLLRNLQNAAVALEQGESRISIIDKAVHHAILMAASHHYPEETGEIQRSRYGGELGAASPKGQEKLLADIAAGDTSKLGTILGFFKRNLITG